MASVRRCCSGSGGFDLPLTGRRTGAVAADRASARRQLLGALAAALGAWWPGLKLALDVDQVTALAEDRERLWAQVTAADFLSREEKRERRGF